MRSTNIIFLVMFLVMVCFSLSFAQTEQEYVVEKNDTLWKIAEKMSVSSRELRKANQQIKNANKIFPGQVIKIPAKEEAVIAKELPASQSIEPQVLQSVIEVAPTVSRTQSFFTKSAMIIFSVKKGVLKFFENDIYVILFLMISILAVLIVNSLLLKKYSDQSASLCARIERVSLGEPAHLYKERQASTSIERFRNDPVFVGVCEHVGVKTFCLIDEDVPVHIIDMEALSKIIINRYGHDFSKKITFKVRNMIVIDKMIGKVRILTAQEQGKLVAKIILSLNSQDNLPNRTPSMIAYG